MANKHIKYIPTLLLLMEMYIKTKWDSYITTRVALIKKIENTEYC